MTDAATTPDEPRKKKRKKREPAAPEVLPGEGTPDGALLREAHAAFDAGHFARVRELSTRLRGSSDPKIADAAAALLARVAVDPVQIGFLCACLVAIAIVFYVYVIR